MTISSCEQYGYRRFRRGQRQFPTHGPEWLPRITYMVIGKSFSRWYNRLQLDLAVPDRYSEYGRSVFEGPHNIAVGKVSVHALDAYRIVGPEENGPRPKRYLATGR